MFRILFLSFSLLLSQTVQSNTVIKIVPIHYRSVDELHAIISPLLNDSEQIIASSSGLIVRANPDRQKELKNLIAELDKPQAALRITVIQSNRETAETLNRSIQGSIQFGSKQSFKPRAEIHGRYANTDDFKQSDKQQQIRTLDGKPAFIKIGKSHPVQHQRIYQPRYSYPVIEHSTEYIEASTGFVVTPRLTGKQVIVEVSPWSDNMKQNGQLSTQSSHTTVRARLGTWMEIAAVEQQQQHQKKKNLSRRYTTAQQQMRILIKVDKISAFE